MKYKKGQTVRVKKTGELWVVDRMVTHRDPEGRGGLSVSWYFCSREEKGRKLENDFYPDEIEAV